jgi:hypothetical protein
MEKELGANRAQENQQEEAEGEKLSRFGGCPLSKAFGLPMVY